MAVGCQLRSSRNFPGMASCEYRIKSGALPASAVHQSVCAGSCQWEGSRFLESSEQKACRGADRAECSAGPSHYRVVWKGGLWTGYRLIPTGYSKDCCMYAGLFPLGANASQSVNRSGCSSRKRVI